MKKRLILNVVLLLSVISYAQDSNPTLMTIGGKDVKLDEFNTIFNKNNANEAHTEASIKEYLDLFIKFKLKVREAEELGYDTVATFIKELKGYRKQLAEPYLTDKDVTEDLIKEAYERMKKDVKASHILVRLPMGAKAKDTLAAHKKIMNIRKRILKGEDFGKVAKEVSEDPSAVKNNGNLGYFRVFDMVYPFETAVYNATLNKVSMPVRTDFGYHLVLLTDKRDARGKIQVAHILVKSGKDADAEQQKNSKQKIQEIYEKLKAGENFEDLAKKYSEDPVSAKKGGEIPAFESGKMVESFENSAYGLKNDGDFSEPVQTSYGWHIIKRIALTPLQPYDELYGLIKSKVTRDSRSNKSKNALVERIKKENNFKENLKERNDFYRVITAEEYMNATWNADKAKNLNKVMFGFYAEDGDKLEYTQQDFANIFRTQSSTKKKVNMVSEINQLYEEKVAEKAIAFLDSRLEKTNDEFRLLTEEYRDGILLFDLTDKKVWSKAVNDTVGLKNFYEQNKNNYMWPQRVKGAIYTCSDEAVAKKVSKLIKKKAKKGYSNEFILQQVNKDSQLNLNLQEGTYAKGDNDLIDDVEWKSNSVTKIVEKDRVELVAIEEVLDPAPKELKEIKGIVISDYQNFLEKNWIEELKGKYEVKVNDEVLKLVK